MDSTQWTETLSNNIRLILFDGIIMPSLPVQELVRRFPLKVKRTRRNVYDLKGEKKWQIWERLFVIHDDCRGYVINDSFVYSCYNCSDQKHCYFIIKKEKLKKEGFEYRE